MILKKLAKVTALGLAALLSLSACGSNNSKPQESGQTEQKPEEKKQVGVADNLVIENEGTPVEDATLKVALISNSPFTGLFNIAYAITATDMRVIEHASVVSFNVDEQFKIGSEPLMGFGASWVTKVISSMRFRAPAYLSIIHMTKRISTLMVFWYSFSKTMSPERASEFPSKAIPMRFPSPSIVGEPEFPPVISLSERKFTGRCPFLSAYTPKSFKAFISNTFLGKSNSSSPALYFLTRPSISV